MPGSWQFWCWKLLSFLVLGGVLASSGDCAKAQIAPDATMGAESSVVTPNVELNGIPSDRIEGGAVRGANLFHSFREFNVGAGRGAYFANPDAIQNILGRVTGGNPSNILGRLGVLGDANLFLINPNGIIFGPNASLDLKGSFVGSTASSLNFADGTQFSATAPQTTPLLTISVPLGLQYGATAGSIQYQSRANNIETGEIGGLLRVQPGKTLAFVGGNVSLSGGYLYAPGGRVELGGLAEPGTVGLQLDGNNLSLSYPEQVQRADVSLTNGVFVNVKAGGGGSIAINARSLDILGGSLLIAGIEKGLGAVDSQAGDITLNATGTIKIAGSNNDRSGILNTVSNGAEGKAGNINIQAGSLSMDDGTPVFASTFGKGDAGSIFVRVDDSVSLANESQISSNVSSGAEGKGGNIDIQARSLSLRNAALGTSIYGRGDAGSVSIQASDSVSFVNSYILNQNIGDFDADGEVAVGKAGNINLQTGSLSLSDGASLGSRTNGLGDAGSVFIRASGPVSFKCGSWSSRQWG